MALRSFLIGLGHAGRNLHLRALRTIREQARTDHRLGALFDAADPLGYDPIPPPVTDGLLVLGSPREAVRHTDPRATVVHLCAPPTVRLDAVAELADLGFRHFLVEKPLATDAAQARALLALARRRGLDLTIVAPWLSSGVTRRIRAAVDSRALGAVRRIAIRQTKPRLVRTAASAAHTNAFDVEPPHSVGVALALAGAAELTSAWLRDTPPIEGRVITNMGGAGLTLAHAGGAVTEIESDLTAAERVRRITVEFEGGVMIGHYSRAADDLRGRVETHTGCGRSSESFSDDALRILFEDTYRRAAGLAGPVADPLDLHRRVVELLDAAKATAGRDHRVAL
ncbi:oxidoreductase [Nocardia terpenica]|uniref:Oxidoreductase n=1 Tax=Nocardia terpenica TaxID=455432 RepID=A0A291RE66_9NOCA|nr:oxidoreductase [Nocardia terpenica]